MKLRSLALNQFRKFTQTTRLDGIGDGLNIVGGPNELGKSTLLAALRAVIFEKYDSKAAPIKELQNTRNQAAPVVMLEFELADGIYRITKRFVKKPYARLDCPDGTELQGEEAEEKLRTLLNFGKPDNRGAKPESLGMWSVLWVQQGDSFGSLGIPQSARSSLHGALDTQVGAVLGGERGRKLPQAIQARLDELVTPANGRPRGEFKALGERVVDLEESLNQLREHRRELTEALDDLEAAQEDLKRLESGKNDRKDLGKV
ncbi:MAG: AAA family ATPase [Gammaproteobacteria bacterium]|nr:AAA family ATPase [Gammaproteobacteria bacterium]MYE29282.1 AAA family ATPase [Gammaproteobacteria bacterium]MYI02622.1 AAA family ATPase [Gammaproteobacteria bacterium]